MQCCIVLLTTLVRLHHKQLGAACRRVMHSSPLSNTSRCGCSTKQQGLSPVVCGFGLDGSRLAHPVRTCCAVLCCAACSYLYVEDVAEAFDTVLHKVGHKRA